MYGSTTKGDVVKRTDCILVYGSTTKGDVVKRTDCILVYGSTTKGDVVKRSDCILVYGSTAKGGVVKRSDCILVCGSTTKGDVVKRSDCILVHGSTIKGDVVKRSDCILVYGSTTKGDVVKRSDCPSHNSLTFKALLCPVSRWIHSKTFPLTPRPRTLFFTLYSLVMVSFFGTRARWTGTWDRKSGGLANLSLEWDISVPSRTYSQQNETKSSVFYGNLS